MTVQSNWWEHFFEGVAVDLWLQAVPSELTEREAESIARLLAVQPGARLLDVPCGGGRLSLALSARGYRVTGVDLSSEFLDHARSRDVSGVVTWERREMRDLPWPTLFDGAFCYGNSFGYLDDNGNETFLRAVAATLKPGARFVLDTPMVLENLIGHLNNRPWWKSGDIYLLVENQYDQARGRLDIAYTFCAGGRVETRYGSPRAYTYRQLVDLMEAAGFAVEPSQPWTREAHTVAFIGTRR